MPVFRLSWPTPILAWNSAAAALYTDFARIPEDRRNYVRLVFTDPAMRTLHTDWEDAARTCVDVLRMEAARDPDNPRLATLVGELSVQDNDFRQWWAAHRVAGTSYGTKTFHHPVVGDLTLDCDTWDCPDDHEQRLVVMTAAPGTPSHEALRILGSWSAQYPAHEDGLPGEPAGHESQRGEGGS